MAAWTCCHSIEKQKYHKDHCVEKLNICHKNKFNLNFKLLNCQDEKYIL